MSGWIGLWMQSSLEGLEEKKQRKRRRKTKG